MLALKNMTVLDLSQVMAGPYCTMVLADLGADVTKIERYPNGDDSRRMGPFVKEESACFMMINRNKKGMTLNLKKKEGKQIFLKLAETADVIVENFRPGIVQSLGVDYEAVARFNPGIIYCSISGYGQTGPYSQKGGFDIMAQGMTGLMSMTGQPGGRPTKAGIAVNDLCAGSTALYAILAAYIVKLQTGKGQYIDTSLVESGLAWTIWESAAYFGAGKISGPTGSRHRVSAPYQAFQTKDDYILVGGANQRTWEKFCREVIDKPEWVSDPRFLTNEDRMANVEKLASCIEEILIRHKSSYWIEKLDKAGVPGGPIYSYEQALKDPHILARNMVEEIEHPKAGKLRTLGIPAKMSLTPGKIRNPAPTLGQHNEEILLHLGYSISEIESLKKQEVI